MTSVNSLVDSHWNHFQMTRTTTTITLSVNVALPIFSTVHSTVTSCPVNAESGRVTDVTVRSGYARVWNPHTVPGITFCPRVSSEPCCSMYSICGEKKLLSNFNRVVNKPPWQKIQNANFKVDLSVNPESIVRTVSPGAGLYHIPTCQSKRVLGWEASVGR